MPDAAGAGASPSSSMPWGKIAGSSSNMLGMFMEYEGQRKGEKAMQKQAQLELDQANQERADQQVNVDNRLAVETNAPMGSRIAAGTNQGVREQTLAVDPAIAAGGRALGVTAGGRASIRRRGGVAMARPAYAASVNALQTDDFEKNAQLENDMRLVQGRAASMRSLSPAKRDLAAFEGIGMRTGGKVAQMGGKAAMEM